MSILSGFKSFEKYIKKQDGYQLMSERTHARDVLFDDNKNLADKFGNTEIEGTLTDTIKKLIDDLKITNQTQSNSNDKIQSILKSISSINTEINNIKNVRLGGITISVLTQSQYNALGSGRPINTLYIIRG